MATNVPDAAHRHPRVTWVSPVTVFKHSWKRHATAEGKPWRRNPAMIAPTVSTLLGIGLAFGLQGVTDGVVATLAGVGAGLSGFIYPVVVTIRGMRAARRALYQEQIKPILDEYEAHLEDRDRTIAFFERGTEPEPLAVLDEIGSRAVR